MNMSFTNLPVKLLLQHPPLALQNGKVCSFALLRLSATGADSVHTDWPNRMPLVIDLQQCDLEAILLQMG